MTAEKPVLILNADPLCTGYLPFNNFLEEGKDFVSRGIDDIAIEIRANRFGCGRWGTVGT